MISLIRRLLNIIEELLEEHERTNQHEHKIFPAISTATIPTVIILLSNDINH